MLIFLRGCLDTYYLFLSLSNGIGAQGKSETFLSFAMSVVTRLGSDKVPEVIPDGGGVTLLPLIVVSGRGALRGSMECIVSILFDPVHFALQYYGRTARACPMASDGAAAPLSPFTMKRCSYSIARTAALLLDFMLPLTDDVLVSFFYVPRPSADGIFFFRCCLGTERHASDSGED